MAKPYPKRRYGKWRKSQKPLKPFKPLRPKEEEYDKEEYIEMQDMKRVRMGFGYDQTIVWLRSCADRLGISVKALILTEETRRAGF